MKKILLLIVVVLTFVATIFTASGVSSSPSEKRPPVTIPYQANANAANFNPGRGLVVPVEERTRMTIHNDTAENIKGGRR